MEKELDEFKKTINLLREKAIKYAEDTFKERKKHFGFNELPPEYRQKMEIWFKEKIMIDYLTGVQGLIESIDKETNYDMLRDVLKGGLNLN